MLRVERRRLLLPTSDGVTSASDPSQGVERLAAEGIRARLLSLPVVKPLDEEAALASVRELLA